jgi:hypothetical protein
MSLRDFFCWRRVHTCARCGATVGRTAYRVKGGDRYCDDKRACVLAALLRIWQEGVRDHD